MSLRVEFTSRVYRTLMSLRKLLSLIILVSFIWSYYYGFNEHESALNPFIVNSIIHNKLPLCMTYLFSSAI